MASLKPLFPQIPTLVTSRGELVISITVILPDMPGAEFKAGDRYMLETAEFGTVETRVDTAAGATTGAEKVWHLTLALV